MNGEKLDPISIERASERLRQERETFNQRKIHEARWFSLRLVMGYTSVVLLAVIVFICFYILLNHSLFTSGVVTAAGTALFADILDLFVGVWKIALNPQFLTKLAPVTQSTLPARSVDPSGSVMAKEGHQDNE